MVSKISELKNAQKTRQIPKKNDKSKWNVRKLNEDRGKEVSEEVFHAMLSKLLDNGVLCGIASILPEYALPQPISTLFQEKFRGLSLPELLEEANNAFKSYSVGLKQLTSIEKLTRMQSTSKLWYSFRECRITGSIAKSVTVTDPLNPSRTTVLKCCYPSSIKISTEATRYASFSNPPCFLNIPAGHF